MITSDSMRGFNDLLVLSLLKDGDSYGYEISKAIARLSADRYVIKETTLYSAMNRLEQQGYIRGYDGLESHGRARTYFTLTHEGHLALAAKTAEWNEIQDVINTVLEGESS